MQLGFELMSGNLFSKSSSEIDKVIDNKNNLEFIYRNLIIETFESLNI